MTISPNDAGTEPLLCYMYNIIPSELITKQAKQHFMHSSI
jgi:hypothetical protein